MTGLKFVSDKFSVPFPQYLPLMVLHDPPGGLNTEKVSWFLIADQVAFGIGLSTASYSNERSTSTVTVEAELV